MGIHSKVNVKATSVISIKYLEVSKRFKMESFYAGLLTFLFPISATSVHPVAQGQFVENLEAIQHFEQVFDTAAMHASGKAEDIDESNRRWDSGITRNGY